MEELHSLKKCSHTFNNVFTQANAADDSEGLLQRSVAKTETFWTIAKSPFLPNLFQSGGERHFFDVDTLLEDGAREQSDDFSRIHGGEDILEHELGQNDFVAWYLTRHPPLQLDGAAVVDVPQALQNLGGELDGNRLQ